jgi:hypothetical protein
VGNLVKLVTSLVLLTGLALSYQNCGKSAGEDIFQSPPTSSVTRHQALSADELDAEQTRLLDSVSTACEKDSDCKAVGFGDKPCGGNKKALIYSALGIDEQSFLDEVDAYNAADKQFNQEQGMVSTCDYTVIPEDDNVLCVDAVCQASY